MNRLLRLLALSGLAALSGLSAASCDTPFKQAKACEEVIQKYFSEPSLAEANPDAFSSLADVPFKADAEGEIRQAYDVGGSCWRTTEAIALECERRCRAFLTADCFLGFAADNTPFADTACNFPERCDDPDDCNHGQDCAVDGCCAIPPEQRETNVSCAVYPDDE